MMFGSSPNAETFNSVCVCVLFAQDEEEECEDCTLALASSSVFLDSRTSGGGHHDHQKALSKVASGYYVLLCSSMSMSSALERHKLKSHHC